MAYPIFNFDHVLAGIIAPGVVLGGVAAAMVAIPILIHLLNRRKFKVVQWAAMEYLLRAMKQNRKRLKFEQWLLLLTRCTVMLAFFLGFAWLAIMALMPAGCAKQTMGAIGGRAGLNVFVIDNGYSTAYEAGHPGDVSTHGGKTHLAQEKLIAQKLIDHLNSGNESVAVFATARPASSVIADPTFDLNAAHNAVGRIDQSYCATDLAGALQLALGVGKQNTSPVKNLFILSDGVRSVWQGSQAEALKNLGPELAKVFTVAHYNMTEGREQANNALLDIHPTDGLVTTKFENHLSVLARGYGTNMGSTAVPLHWTLDGFAMDESHPITVKADPSSDPILLTLRPSDFKGPGSHVVKVTLGGGENGSGDALAPDNRRYRIVNVADQLKVLIVDVEGSRTGKALDKSGAYLQMALSPPAEDKSETGAARNDGFLACDLVSEVNWSDQLLTDYKAVILCGIGQLSDKQADAVKHFVQAGGTLLVFMGEEIGSSVDTYNKILLPRGLMPGPLIRRVDGGDTGGYIFDFKPAGQHHAFLKMFQNEENTGLDTARTYVYWQADIPPNSGVERVLNYIPTPNKNDADPAAKPPRSVALHADQPDPAITVHSLGQGRVIFFATSASPGNPSHEVQSDSEAARRKEADMWTTFPAKMAYVELMNEILSASLRTDDAWMNLSVGQPLRIPSDVQMKGAPKLSDENKQPVLISPLADTDPESQVAISDRPPGYLSKPLTRPGLYDLELGDRLLHIAVNPPAEEEADVRCIGNEEIRKSLGGIRMSLQGDEIPADQALAKEGGDAVGLFMLGTLALLAVECFMAMTFGHYRRAGDSSARTMERPKAAMA